MDNYCRYFVTSLFDRDSQSDMCFFLQAENQLIYSNAIPAIVKIDDCLHVPMSATTAISVGSDNGLKFTYTDLAGHAQVSHSTL